MIRSKQAMRRVKLLTVPELSNSFNNGLVREEEESWKSDTDDISSDYCPGIGCFPMQANCVGVSKEGQASAFKCCGDVTGRSVNCKDSFGVPYNPEIILDSGLSSDALDRLNQLATNCSAMLFLPVLGSRRHDNRTNAIFGQSIDRYRPFFWSPILTSPTGRGVDVQVIGR
jgi:hypothetical protein